MTDSAAILDALTGGKAAFAPLGGIGEEMAGYKGYSYTVVVELLSAALQGGNYMKMLTGIDPNGEKVPYHLGHFFHCCRYRCLFWAPMPLKNSRRYSSRTP